MFQRHPCCMWWTLVLIVLTTSTTFFVVAQIVPPSPNISYQYIDCPSSSTTASDMMIQASVLTVAHDNTTTTSLLLSRDYFWWVYNCSVPRRIFVTSSNITSTTTQPSSYSFSFFRVIIATAIVSLSVSEHVDRCDVFFYASDATAPPSDAPANFFGSSSSFTYLVRASATIEHLSVILIGGTSGLDRYVNAATLAVPLSQDECFSLPELLLLNDSTAKGSIYVPPSSVLVALDVAPSLSMLLVIAEEVDVLVDAGGVLHVTKEAAISKDDVTVGGISFLCRGNVTASMTETQKTAAPNFNAAFVVLIETIDSPDNSSNNSNSLSWWVTHNTITGMISQYNMLPQIIMLISRGAFIELQGTLFATSLLQVRSTISWNPNSFLNISVDASITVNSTTAFQVHAPLLGGIALFVGEVESSRQTASQRYSTSNLIHVLGSGALLYVSRSPEQLMASSAIREALYALSYPFSVLCHLQLTVHSTTVVLDGELSSLLQVPPSASFSLENNVSINATASVHGVGILLSEGVHVTLTNGATIAVLQRVELWPTRVLVHRNGTAIINGSYGSSIAASLAPAAQCCRASSSSRSSSSRGIGNDDNNTDLVVLGWVCLSNGSVVDANTTNGALFALGDAVPKHTASSMVSNAPSPLPIVLASVVGASQFFLRGKLTSAIVLAERNPKIDNSSLFGVVNRSSSVFDTPITFVIDGPGTVVQGIYAKNSTSSEPLLEVSPPTLLMLRRVDGASLQNVTSAAEFLLERTVVTDFVIRNESLVNDTALISALANNTILRNIAISIDDRATYLLGVGMTGASAMTFQENATISNLEVHVANNASVVLWGVSRIIGYTYAGGFTIPPAYQNIHFLITNSSTVQQEEAGLVYIRSCRDALNISVTFLNQSKIVMLQPPDTVRRETGAMLTIVGFTDPTRAIDLIAVLVENSDAIAVRTTTFGSTSPLSTASPSSLGRCVRLVCIIGLSGIVRNPSMIIRSSTAPSSLSSPTTMMPIWCTSNQVDVIVSVNYRGMEVQQANIVVDSVDLIVASKGFFIVAPVWTNGFVVIGPSGKTTTTTTAGLAPQLLTVSNTSSFMNMGTFTQSSILIRNHVTVLITNGSIAFSAVDVISDLDVTMKCEASGGDACTYFPKVVVNGQISPLLRSFFVCTFGSAKQVTLSILDGSSLTLANRSTLLGAFLVLDGAKIIAEKGGGGANVVDASSSIHVLSASSLIGTGGSRAIVQHIVVSLTSTQELVINGSSFLIASAGGPDNQTATAAVSNISMSLTGIELLRLTTASSFISNDVALLATLTRPQLRLQNVFIGFVNCSDMLVSSSTLTNFRDTLDVAIVMTRSILYTVGAVLVTAVAGANNNSPATIDGANFSVCDSGSRIVMTASSFLIGSSVATITNSVLTFERGVKASLAGDSRLIDAGTGVLRNTSLSILSGCDWNCSAVFFLRGVVVNDVRITIGGNDTVVKLASVSTSVMVAVTRASNIRFDICDGATVTAVNTQMAFLYAPQATDIDWKLHGGASVLLSSAATGWMCLTNATNVSMSFRGSSAGGPPPPPGRSGGGQFYMSDSSVWMLVPIMKLITVTVESGFQNFVLNTSSSFVRNSGNIIDFAFYVLSGSRITIVRRSGVLLSTSSNGIFNNTDFLVDGIDTLVSLDGGFLASGSTSSTINYLLNVANFRIWVSGGCRVQLANSANIFYHPNTLQRVTVGVTDASTLSLSSSSIGFEDVVASVSKFNTTVVRGGQLLLEDESTVLQASSKPALVMTDVLLSVSGSGSVAWISYSSHFLDVFYGALIESVTIFVDWNGSVNVSEQSYGVFLLLVTSVRLVSVVLQTNATLAVGSSTPSSSPSYVIDFLGCRNVSRFTFSAVGDATEATSRVVFGTSGYVSAFDCYIAETTAVVRDAIISVANARLEMLSSTGGLSLVALFSDCQRESVPAVSNITVSYTNVVIVISGTAQLHPGIYSAGTILQNWQMRLANVSVERGDSQRANPSAPRYVVGGPTVIFFFQERGNSAINSNGVATMTNSTIFLNPTDLEMNALRNDIILMNGGGSGSFLTPPTSTELAALLDSNTFDSLQQRRGGIYVVLWFCRSGRFGNTTIALDNVAAIGGNRTAALLAINTAQLTNSDLVVRVTRAYMMLNCSATLLELRNITTTAGTATQQRVQLTVDQSKVWMRGSDGSAPRSNSQLLYLEGTTVSPSAIVTIVMHSNVTVGPRASLCNATRVCGGASSTGTPSSSNVTVRIESSVVQLSPTDRVSLWSPPRSPATLYDTGRLDDYLPLQQTSLVQVDISGTCTAATQQQEPAAVPSCSLSNATTTTALMLTLSVQDTIVTVFPWMIPAEIARAMPLSTLLNLHQSSSIARIEASTSYNATCSSNTSKNAVIMHVGTRVELRNDSSLIMSMPSMVAASVDLFNDGRAETISSSAPVVSVIGSVGLTPSSSYVAVNGNVSSVVVSGNVTVEGFPAVLGSQLFSQPSIPLDVQWETCHTTRRSGSGGGSPHDYASSAMWRYGGIRRAFGAKSAVNLLLLDLSTNSSEFSSTNTTKNNNSTGNSSSLVLLLALSRLPEVRFDVLRTQQVGKGACVPDRILSPTFSMSDVGSSSSTASESQEMLPSPTVALMISVSKGITPSNRDPSGTTTQLLSDEFSHSFPSPSITISEEPKAQAFRAQAQAVKYREVVRATVAVGLSAVSGGSLAGVGIAFTTRTGSSLLECGRDVNENVDWLLNPLQLRTGPSEGGGSLRGAVIGNIVLTSAMMVMMVAVAAGCARRHYRGGDEDKQFGLGGHRQRSNHHQHVEHFYRILAKGFRFPGILLAPYSILIIPIGSTVAAALLLLNPNDIGDNDGDGTLVNVVLALLSVLLVGVGYFLIGAVVLFQFQARFQLQPQMFDRDEETKGSFTPSFALMLEMARAFVTRHTVLGAWANLPTTTTTTDSSTRPPKFISRALFVERYGYLFDGFCNGRHWYVLLDCAFAAAVCLIDGLQPPALPSVDPMVMSNGGGAAIVEAQDTGSSRTPNCTPHLIALSICSALQFFACLFLRPSMVPFDTAFGLFTDAIGALAAAVGAANATGATELFDMVMWIGVIQLALAICSVASASGSVSSSIRRWVAEFLVSHHNDEGVHQFDDLQRSWEELQQIPARERNFNEGGKKAHHVRKDVSMCQLLEEENEDAFENVIAMQCAPQDDVLHVDQLISPPLPSSRSFGKTYRLRRADSHNNIKKRKSSSSATPEEQLAFRAVFQFLHLWDIRSGDGGGGHRYAALRGTLPTLDHLITVASWHGAQKFKRQQRDVNHDA